jgi:hypothetical protein
MVPSVKPIFSIAEVSLGNLVVFRHHDRTDIIHSEGNNLYLVTDILDDHIRVHNINSNTGLDINKRFCLNLQDIIYDPEDNWNYYLL